MRRHLHTSRSVLHKRSDEMDLLDICCAHRSRRRRHNTRSQDNHQRRSTSPSTPLPVVLDIQCFRNNLKEFIIKEVCVIDVLTGTLLLHHVVKSPFSKDKLCVERKRETNWLVSNWHGLEWDQGDIAYDECVTKLRECLKKCTTVYVKGLEKKMFLVEKILSSPSTSENASAPMSEGVDEVDSSSSSSSSSRHMLPVICDMTILGCKPITVIDRPNSLIGSHKLRCDQHKSIHNSCALSNCTLLRNWLLVTGIEP